MVKRVLLAVGAGTACFTILVAGYLYARLSPFSYEQVSDDVYMVKGFGGNVAILRTDDGAVVVDSMTFGFQGKWIRKLAERLSGGPIRAVINTHYHQDHTHGNPAFAGTARFVATANTRKHLVAIDADYWTGEAAATLPADTFVHDHVMEIGGKTILSMYKGRGHTDGDLVVLFVEDRVLHAGDLVFNSHWPNIDLEAGSSIPAWIETLNAVADLGFDRVIPGHGAVTDRRGIRQFQTFLRELWREVRAAVKAGMTVDEARANVKLPIAKDFEVFSVPTVISLDRGFVIGRAWEEAARAAGSKAQPTAAGS